ncbi:MAG: hypothetical protein U5P41_09780 [Gammaproteobacteria bacterium]|nr:hypothetical protein [Gammaproteobacteria bacterium]
MASTQRSKKPILRSAAFPLLSGDIVVQASGDITVSGNLESSGTGRIHLEADSPHTGGLASGGIDDEGALTINGQITTNNQSIALIADTHAVNAVVNAGSGTISAIETDNDAGGFNVAGGNLSAASLNNLRTTGDLILGEATTAGTGGTVGGGTTITNDLVTLGDGGAFTINSNVAGTVQFVANNEIRINNNVTSSGNNLLYSGDVTLGNDLDITVSTGAADGDIDVTGSINGNATAGDETLTLNAGTGAITLNAVAGAGGVADAAGLTALTITDSAAASFGAIDLTGALTQTNPATGTTTFNGAVSVDSATLRGTDFDVLDGFTTTAGTLSVTNSSLFTKNATGSINAAGGFSTTGDASLASDVSTTDSALSLGGTLTVADNITLSTDAGTGADIQFDGAVDAISAGVEDLILTAGSGSITFSDVVGGGQALGDVTINSAGDLDITAAFNVGAFDVTAETDTDVFLGNAGVGLHLSDTELGQISADSLSVSTLGTGAITIEDTTAANTDDFGTLTLNGASGVMVAANGTALQNAVDITGATDLAGNLMTVQGTIDFHSAVTVSGANVVVEAGTTTPSALTFDSTITGVANTENLDLLGSSIQVDGAISNLATLDVGDGDTTTITVNNASTTNTQNYTATTIELAGDTYESNDGNLLFDGAVDLTGTTPVTLDSDADNAGADGSIEITGNVSDTGNNSALTIVANTDTVDVADIVVNDAIDITGGNIDLNGTTYTSGTGAIDLDGSVDLDSSGALTLTSGGGNNITVTGAIEDTGNNSNLDLVAGAGNVLLQSNAGDANYLGSFTITSATLADLQSITTTGNIDITADDVELNGDLSTAGAAVGTGTGSIDISATGSIDLEAAGAGTGSIALVTDSGDPGDTHGAITIDGGATVASVTPWEDGLTLNAGNGAADLGAVTLDELDYLDVTADTFTLADATLGDGAGNGGVGLSVTTTGDMSLNGDISTAGDSSNVAGSIDLSGVGGAITLDDDGADNDGIVTITSNAATNDASINLGAIQDGGSDFDLTVDADTANVTAAAIGTTDTIGALDITGNDIFLTDGVQATGILITAGNNVTADINGSSFDIRATTDDITINALGTLTLEDGTLIRTRLVTDAGDIILNLGDLVIQDNDTDPQIVAAGNLTINPGTGKIIDLGNDSDLTADLNLDDGELNALSATGTITIGAADAGRIILDMATAFTPGDLTLLTDSTINDNDVVTGGSDFGFRSTGTLTLTSNGIIGDAAVSGADGLTLDVAALTVTDTGSNNVIVTDTGANNGDTTYSIGTNTDAGNVTITQTTNNLVVADINTGANTVTLDSVDGNINDNAATTEVIAASDLRMNAETGINALNTAVTNLAAETEEGNLEVFNTGALTIAMVNGLSGVTITDTNGDNTGGIIEIRAASPLTVNEDVVNNDGGDIILAAEGNADTDDLTVAANIDTNGGDGNIGLYAGDDIAQTAGDIIAAGNGTITLNAGVDYNGGGALQAGFANSGTITQSGGTIAATNGLVDLNASEDISITSVSTAGNVTITADDDFGLGLSNDSGVISENGADATADISGATATLRAATGIGDGDAIETNIDTLDALSTISGNVQIFEVVAGGALDINQAATTAGNIDVRTGDGTLTVMAGQSGVSTDGAGTVALVAGDDGGSNGDDLVLNDAVGAATGMVTLTSATNDVLFSADGDVTTTSGDIQVNAGAAGDGLVTMADGTVLQAIGAGDIDINGVGDVTIGQLITAATGATAIDVVSTAGAILDAGNTGGADLQTGAGGRATLTANGAIGAADGIETAVTELFGSTTAAGIVDINETDGLTDVNFSTNDGSFTLDAGGAVSVSSIDTSNTDDDANDVTINTTTGDIEITSINAGTVGDVFLDTDNGAVEGKGAGPHITAQDIDIDATTGIGAAVALSLSGVELFNADTSEGDIDMDNAATSAVEVASMTTAGAGGTIDYDQTGNQALALSTVSTTDGDVTISNSGGTAADIEIGSITADSTDDTVMITADGTIDDATAGNDGVTDITGNTVDLNAVEGIGATNPLELATAFVSADTTNGDIDLDNDTTDAVSVTGLTTGTGTITLEQTGNTTLDIDGAVSASGDITLRNTGDDAADTLTLADTVSSTGMGIVTVETLTRGNIAVDADVTTANGGTINMTAADSLAVQAAATTISVGATGTIALRVDSGDGATTSLDLGGSSLTANSIDLTGGNDGDDTLIAQDVVSNWTIDGGDTGTLSNNNINGGGTAADFTDFANLTGAATQDDSFVFAVNTDNPDISGTIDSRGGSDTLDWSGYDAPITVNLNGIGGTDGFNGDAPGVNAFSNIDVVIADSDETNSINGIDGIDATWAFDGGQDGTYTDDVTGQDIDWDSFTHLTGRDGKDTFNVDVNHTGDLAGGAGEDEFNFTLTTVLDGDVDGGADDDRFVFANSARITGFVDGGLGVDPGNGNDEIDFSASVLEQLVTIDTGGGTVDGSSGTIEDGPTDDGFNLDLLGTGFDNINSLVGNNLGTIIGPNADTWWDVTDTNQGTFGDSLSNVADNAFAGFTIIGGTADDTYIFQSDGFITNGITGGLGENILVGSAGVDRFLITADGDVSLDVGNNATDITTLTDISRIDGTEAFLTMPGVETDTGNDIFDFDPGVDWSGDLHGAGGDDVFNLTESITGMISGGDGVDTFNLDANVPGPIAGDAGDDIFHINVNQTGGNVLTGGADDDTFNIAAGITVAAGINGGTNATAAGDVLDWSAFGANMAVSLTGADGDGFDGSGAGTGFSNINTVTGAAGQTNSLTGYNTEADWDIDGTNTYTDDPGNVLNFSVFENFIGNADVDRFNITAAHTGNLNAADGADIFNFDADLNGTASGDAGSDTFNLLTDNLAITNMAGGSGTDEIVASNNATTFNITGNGSGNVDDGVAKNYTGVENLTGGTADDVFNASASHTGNLSGNDGDDDFNFTAGTLNGTAFGNDGDDEFFLTGGGRAGFMDGGGHAGGDTLDASGATGNVTLTLNGNFTRIEDLTGNGGNSTLVGDSGSASDWDLNSASGGTLNTIPFDGFNTVRSGSGGNNTLTADGSYNGTVNLRGTRNTWDYTTGATLTTGAVTGNGSLTIGEPAGGPGGDMTVGGGDLVLPNLAGLTGPLFIGGVVDPATTPLNNQSVTINTDILTVNDVITTGGDIVLLGGQIDLDAPTMNIGGQMNFVATGTDCASCGPINGGAGDGNIHSNQPITVNADSGLIIAAGGIQNSDNLTLDFGGGDFQLAVSQAQQDTSTPNQLSNAFGIEPTNQTFNFINILGLNVVASVVNFFNPALQLFALEDISFIDTGLFEEELSLFGVIGEGIALALAQCEEIEGCAPNVTPEELDTLIEGLEARIGELEKRIAETADPAMREELEQLLADYQAELREFMGYKEELTAFLTGPSEGDDLGDDLGDDFIPGEEELPDEGEAPITSPGQFNTVDTLARMLETIQARVEFLESLIGDAARRAELGARTGIDLTEEALNRIIENTRKEADFIESLMQRLIEESQTRREMESDDMFSADAGGPPTTLPSIGYNAGDLTLHSGYLPMDTRWF